MADAGDILTCEAVGKQYGSLAAVDWLSFAVRRGEVFGIGGPNGAGKTTLFDVVTGISPATGGRVRLGGRDITTLSPDRICQLGIARTFQLNAVFETLSLRENVEVAAYFGHRRRGLPGLSLGRPARLRAMAALEFVGLASRADRPVAGAAVLERKLLMIAGAIATAPDVILLDEPVGGLTPAEIEQVMGVVRRMVAAGITIVLIEHVMRFLLALSSRVMIMHHGRKLFEGPPQAVAEDPDVRRTYLGEAATARLKQMFSPDGAAHA